MTRRTDRSPSDEFTTVERRLLDLLCAGDDATSARSQLASKFHDAREWGGPASLPVFSC